MADNEDVSTLKRRGRRRLVGAIALVLAAVIVLPMIFDSEPRQSPPPVSVRIPSEDATGFTPKVTSKSPPTPGSEKSVATPEPKPEAKADAKPEPEPRPEPIKEAKPEPKKEAKPVATAPEKPAVVPAVAPVERAKAEAALAGGQFMVPVGAYLDPARAIEKLKAAGIPHFTEPGRTVKEGTLTSVRAGPFASEQAAEKALAQLTSLGLKPGKVLQRN